MICPSTLMDAQRLILDAKAPDSAAYAGGHGQAFDWQILEKLAGPQPWMLAGV